MRDARTEDVETILLPDADTYRRAAVRLHLEITELEGILTVQARPVLLCDPCPSLRLTLSDVGIRTADVLVADRTAIALPVGQDPAAQKLDLTATGSPIRYPFDA